MEIRGTLLCPCGSVYFPLMFLWDLSRNFNYIVVEGVLPNDHENCVLYWESYCFILGVVGRVSFPSDGTLSGA